ELTDKIALYTDLLKTEVEKIEKYEIVTDEAYAIRDAILPVMAQLRAAADEAETLTAEQHWPFPTYGDLLFSVR
ncbi:MAG: glutamine synthetase type III, partial [Peptococcaceae bacterium]|nr:glutamine synthetase type III [Peptococcaceae bacterium]